MTLEVVTSDIAELVDSIPSNVAFGDDIWGLAFEKESKRFLWVNNQITKKIYKIDIEAPTSAEQKSDEALYQVRYTVTPENVSVFIPLKGTYTVSLVTLQGRTVTTLNGHNANRFTFYNAERAAGIYLISMKSNSYNSVWKLVQ